ncbi:MAG TPA: hypothetical protein VJ917_07575, partial [Saprospiraceae bacterium]|nr:hypothetical protein [Saprospiraceae bacterium]
MRLYSITSNIRFTFCLLLLCGPFFSWAQFCGTEQYHRYLSEKYLIEDQEIEKEYRQHQISRRHKINSPQVIPVVVHIIHQNGPDNIPESRINTEIERLNDIFSNSVQYYDAQGNDT